jgi:hypothetical protein
MLESGRFSKAAVTALIEFLCGITGSSNLYAGLMAGELGGRGTRSDPMSLAPLPPQLPKSRLHVLNRVLNTASN